MTQTFFNKQCYDIKKRILLPSDLLKNVMNYTLNQLRIFLKVVQKESITKAAEELFLTQPAVSIQLKNFQEQFDIPLTEIVNKRLYVTDFGREIALATENILNEVQKINHKTSAFKGRMSGKLRISVVSTGKYVMPYFLTGFMKENPDVELAINATNKSRVNETLEKNEVDFALMSVLPENIRLQHVQLMQNKLFFIGNTETKFDNRKHPVTVLENLPLIYREEGSATRAEMEKFIHANKINVMPRMELSSNEAIKQSVMAGLGFSILPLIGLKNELTNNQIQIIQVQGLPIITNWHLVWLNEKKLSPVATSFLDYVNREKDNIIAKYFDWYEGF